MGSQVFSALKVEAVNVYEVLVIFCHGECCHIAEDGRYCS